MQSKQLCPTCLGNYKCQAFSPKFVIKSNGEEFEKQHKKGNENGTRDYSHLPRARDFKLPKKIPPELQELMNAKREAMEALRQEEEKYGKKPRF